MIFIYSVFFIFFMLLFRLLYELIVNVFLGIEVIFLSFEFFMFFFMFKENIEVFLVWRWSEVFLSGVYFFLFGVCCLVVIRRIGFKEKSVININNIIIFNFNFKIFKGLFFFYIKLVVMFWDNWEMFMNKV